MSGGNSGVICMLAAYMSPNFTNVLIRLLHHDTCFSCILQIMVQMYAPACRLQSFTAYSRAECVAMHSECMTVLHSVDKHIWEASIHNWVM